MKIPWSEIPVTLSDTSFLEGIGQSDHILQLVSKLKHYVVKFNIFPSVPPSIDQYELRTQRISTKLFILLLTASLTILLLYTSLIRVTKTINVETPSFARYEQLYSTYSPTLTCPCTKISLNYDKFLHVDYKLHQVCNTTLVNQSWIDYLAMLTYYRLFAKEFLATSPSAFQTLKTFCELINRTISDSLIEFYSRQYVSASVTSSQLFESKTKSSIDQFRSSMTNRFLLSHLIIRDTTQANALFSGLQSNYVLRVADNNYYVEINRVIYMDCDCRSSSTCIEQSSIHRYPLSKSIFNVSGFYTGCYMVESLLQSTLECFYDQQCIDKLRSYLSQSWRVNLTVLNSSLPSLYSINSTIKDLIDNLMIEEWTAPAIYEKYYNACQPIQCTYTIETRNDVIYIVTTLLGIAGGLITILKLVVPRLVKIVRKKKEHPRPATGKTKLKNEKVHDVQIRCLKKKQTSFYLTRSKFTCFVIKTRKKNERFPLYFSISEYELLMTHVDSFRVKAHFQSPSSDAL